MGRLNNLALSPTYVLNDFLPKGLLIPTRPVAFTEGAHYFRDMLRRTEWTAPAKRTCGPVVPFPIPP